MDIGGAYKLVSQYQYDLKIWKKKTGNTESEPVQRRSIREKPRENERRVKNRRKTGKVSRKETGMQDKVKTGRRFRPVNVAL